MNAITQSILGESGYVMSAEQIARHDDEQPEPQYEHEYRESVGDKIGERESAVEQHCRSPPCRSH
jgi:hypothetical protein